MGLIAEDYFKGGKNLFPGGTEPHLAQLIRELQKITGGVGFEQQVMPIGPDSEFTTLANALAATTDNGAAKPYVYLLEPREYAEDVTLKPYTFVIGRGPSMSRITGRVVGPASGIAGMYGCDVKASTATPVIDLSAGVLRLDDVTVKNEGSGQSIRVTGGLLEFARGKTLDGPVQITGGEAIFGRVELNSFAGSVVSGGKLRIFDGQFNESASGFVFTVSGGEMEIGYARVKNTAGGFMLVTGGALRYVALLEESILAGALMLKSTAGTIESGLKNFALGVKATGWVQIASNSFDAGDIFTLNGVAFEQGVEFTPGVDATATALALKNAISASVNPLIAGKLTAAIDGGDPTKINFTAVVPGTDGNLISMAETDNATDNFVRSGATLTGGSGRTDIVGATVQALTLGL